jgi:hypothetical protein
MSYGSWRLTERSGESTQTTYVPKGTMVSIIIITYISGKSVPGFEPE